jgi:hypothetical protein
VCVCVRACVINYVLFHRPIVYYFCSLTAARGHIARCVYMVQVRCTAYAQLYNDFVSLSVHKATVPPGSALQNSTLQYRHVPKYSKLSGCHFDERSAQTWRCSPVSQAVGNCGKIKIGWHVRSALKSRRNCKTRGAVHCVWLSLNVYCRAVVTDTDGRETSYNNQWRCVFGVVTERKCFVWAGN